MLLNTKARGVAVPMFLMGLRGSTLAVKFGLTLFIAKYLSLEALGIYGLLASAQILLPAIATLGINQSLARHAVTDDPEAIVERLRGYLLILVLFYVLSGGFGWLVVRDDPTWASVFVLSFSLLVLENINSDAYNLLTNRLRPILANVLHFIRSALWTFFFVAFSFLDADFRTLQSLLLFWLIGSGCAFVIFVGSVRDWPFKRLFSRGLSLQRDLRSQIGESWFLYVNGIVTSVGLQADRFIITALLGLELTGVYVFFVQIGSALSNLQYTGIIQLRRPTVLLSLQQGMDAFNGQVAKVLYSSLVSTILTSVIAFFAIQWVLPYLQKPQLLEWFSLMYFILAGVIINVMIEAQRLYFYSLRKDRVAFYINLFASLMALVLLALLLDIYSLIGAGLARVIAGGLRLLAQYMSIERINRKMQMEVR